MKRIIIISMIFIFSSCSVILKNNAAENGRRSTSQTGKANITKSQAAEIAKKYFASTDSAEWLLRQYPKSQNKEPWTIETQETETRWVVTFRCKPPVILTGGMPKVVVNKETGAIDYGFLQKLPQ
jgi:uncharacterized protein YceK